MKDKIYRVCAKPQLRYGKMKSFAFLVYAKNTEEAGDVAAKFLEGQIKGQIGKGHLDYIKVTVVKEVKFDGILRSKKNEK